MSDQPAQEYQPLPAWLYLIFWFLLPAFRGQRYADVARMLIESRKAYARRKKINALAADLRGEAKIYEQCIRNRLASLGYMWAARTQFDHGAAAGSGRAKPTTFKVRFQGIWTKPEVIYLKLLIRERTLFGTRSALPHRVPVLKLLEDDTLKELGLACERKVSAAYDPDNPRHGAFYIVHRLEGIGMLPKIVKWRDMLEHYPADMTLIPWVMGVGKSRKIQSLYLAKHPHLLIAGPTGTGKSNAVNGFILGLMERSDPDDLKFLLIDLKEGVEFEMYVGAPHLYHDIVRKPEEALAALTEMSIEIDRRLQLLRESGAKDLPGYNRAHPDNKLPVLITVIDEYAQLVLPVSKKVREEANRLVVRISALGRAPGVQIIVCTQYPTREVIDPQIKINLNLKVAFRCQNATQSMVILNDPRAAELPADVPGRALFALGPDIFEVQIAHVLESDVKEILKRAQERTAQQVSEPPVTEAESEPAVEAPAQEPAPEIDDDTSQVKIFLRARYAIDADGVGVGKGLLYMSYRVWAGEKAASRERFVAIMQELGFECDAFKWHGIRAIVSGEVVA